MAGCNSNKNSPADKTEGKTKKETDYKNLKSGVSSLSLYDVENENAKSVKLPSEMRGISGICFSDDDRLFCETDENSTVFQFDFNSGSVVKKFYLKDNINSGDFEDICIVGTRFFLAQDHGTLFEFKEGANGEGVDYKSYKTFLTRENNVEGLCYDPETNSLLLACKKYPGEGYDKMRAVYSFPLNSMTLTEKPRFLIPIKPVKRNSFEEKFNPSGIARNPQTGTFFIIASRGNTIIEISKDGEILNQKDLPKEVHTQPEGIAFSRENTLYISNEGKSLNKPAKIVMYMMNK